MRIIFKGVKVYDGTKSDPFIADVSVENGKIAAISNHLSGTNELD